MPFVTCPKCDHEHQAPRELIGLLVDCPKCGEPIEVDDSGGRSGVLPSRRKRKRSRSSFPVWVTFLVIGVALVGGLGLCIALVRTAGERGAKVKAGPNGEGQGEKQGKENPAGVGTKGEKQSGTSGRENAQDLRAYTAKLKATVPLDVPDFKKTGLKAESYVVEEELNMFRSLVLKVEPVYLTDGITGETRKYTRARLVRNNPAPARFNGRNGLMSIPEPFEWVTVEMLP